MTHIVPFFETLSAVTGAACASYARKRLGVVKRVTVKKEQSTLRRFLAWCDEQGYVDGVVAIPPLPRRAPGTPFHKRRRGRATELSVDEARAVIERLHEWSNPPNAKPFAVRSRFVVEFETTLRPSTLDALSIPEHYQRRAACIKLTDEIDKTRFGRDLPLSAEARAALFAIAPESGLLFGEHDYRDQLREGRRVRTRPAQG